ncbi:hypothetical protein R6Q59_006678 [Mikania micrantha]
MDTCAANRLEVQEQQIKQLQSDVQEIKTMLQSIEGDRVESAEFRQVVLVWMKQQEKRNVDGSSGSGFSSGIFSSSGTPPISSDSMSGLPWAVKKVKLPEFSGFDPQGWIQKANVYFDINQTPNDLRVLISNRVDFLFWNLNHGNHMLATVKCQRYIYMWDIEMYYTKSK